MSEENPTEPTPTPTPTETTTAAESEATPAPEPAAESTIATNTQANVESVKEEESTATFEPVVCH